MKLLIITNLFPNACEPNRSTFNCQQFTALAGLCELKIVAPVPLGGQGVIPYHETVAGIEVYHPRYLAVPKFGRITHGLFFFIGIWHTLTSILRFFEYDTILAAWAYPDAVGASVAANLLGKRFFVKVHGSDINLAHRYFGRTRMIRRALGLAHGIIAVSRPLKDKLIAMGIPPDRITVLPNGIDKTVFYKQDQEAARASLGLAADKSYVVFIGNLVEVKGVEYLLRAFALLCAHLGNTHDLGLVIVGDGVLRASLENLAGELKINDRISFKGRQDYAKIPLWLNAADVFCLPSLAEGCPNVVLEALACGTIVVATRVGGIPDIIDTPDKGWLVAPQDPDALAGALRKVFAAVHPAEPVPALSWEENAKILFEVIKPSCPV